MEPGIRVVAPASAGRPTPLVQTLIREEISARAGLGEDRRSGDREARRHGEFLVGARYGGTWAAPASSRASWVHPRPAGCVVSALAFWQRRESEAARRGCAIRWCFSPTGSGGRRVLRGAGLRDRGPGRGEYPAGSDAFWYRKHLMRPQLGLATGSARSDGSTRHYSPAARKIQTVAAIAACGLTAPAPRSCDLAASRCRSSPNG